MVQYSHSLSILLFSSLAMMATETAACTCVSSPPCLHVTAMWPVQEPAAGPSMAPGQAPAPAPSSIPVINLSLDLAGAGLSNLTAQDGVAVREALADRLHICESSWPFSSLHT